MKSFLRNCGAKMIIPISNPAPKPPSKLELYVMAGMM
jgi:hypothetical protein